MYMADNVHILHKLYTRAHWCIIKAPINILMLYHVDFSMAFIPYYRSNKLQSSWNFYSGAVQARDVCILIVSSLLPYLHIIKNNFGLCVVSDSLYSAAHVEKNSCFS